MILKVKKWLLNRVKSFERRMDSHERELNKLAILKRYTKSSFRWTNDSRITFPDAASFVFTYREVFKKNIYKFIADRKDPLIIDCGANIGLSVIYLKELYPASHIVAFEPERSIYKYLTKNVEALSLQGVELINKAVWSKNTILLFNNEGADASRISSLDTNDNFKSTYEVEAVTLSSYITQRVDFLKLDIEGAELDVMQEIEHKLDLIDRLFIEYHSFEKGTQQLDVILNILSRNNFHYYIDSPNRMREIPFVDHNTFYSFDFFLNIYAIKNRS